MLSKLLMNKINTILVYFYYFHSLNYQLSSMSCFFKTIHLETKYTECFGHSCAVCITRYWSPYRKHEATSFMFPISNKRSILDWDSSKKNISLENVSYRRKKWNVTEQTSTSALFQTKDIFWVGDVLQALSLFKVEEGSVFFLSWTAAPDIAKASRAL